MLGPLSKKLIIIGYLWGTYLGHLPYWWDKNSKTIRTSMSKLRYVSCTYGFIASINGVLWLSVRTLQISDKKQDSLLDMSNYMIGMVMTLCSIFPVVLNFNVLRVRYELPQFLCQHINFATNFNQYFLKQEKKSSIVEILKDKAGLFQLTIYGLSGVIQFMIFLIMCFYTDLPLLLTSLGDMPLLWFVPVFVFQTVITMYYVFIWFGSMFCQAFPAIEYVFALQEVMDELELHRKRYTTSSRLRTPPEFMKIWREVQILHANAMNVYAPIVLPANQWLFSVWSVYCIYGFIKLSGPFAFVTFVAAFLILVYLLVMYSVLAQVHVRSGQVLVSWASQRGSPLMRRFLRSTHSVKISVGSFYFTDPGMILKMLKFIVESTVNLIVVN